MHRPSSRNVVAALSRRASRTGLRAAMLGAIAFALPTHILAQGAHATAPQATAPVVAEAPFLKDNQAAMIKMMNDMEIKPTGDIDRDFVATMSPHHQGAIDMAISELRYGKNEQLRRIAQEIIVDQMQEIAAMKIAIGEAATSSMPAPTQQQPAAAAAEQHHVGHDHIGQDHSRMQMSMSAGMKK